MSQKNGTSHVRAASCYKHWLLFSHTLKKYIFLKILSAFAGGPYGRLASVLIFLNIEIIIIIIIIIIRLLLLLFQKVEN